MELLTPAGIAGVAIVRAGADEQAVVRTLLRRPGGGPCRLVPGQPPVRAELCFDGSVVDDVLALDRGSHGLELHLHGSAAVLAALRQRFPLHVALPASPAAQLVCDALSIEQLQFGLEQQAYDFGSWCRQVAGLPAASQRAELAAARRRSRIAQALVEPQRVVLVGRQNAGKSSLFNCLLARERVVTGPTPGLTRDPVAERTALAGYPYELVDTAGLANEPRGLDAAAIERGVKSRAGALVLLVIDAAVGPSDEDRRLLGACAAVVANKCDLKAAPWPSDVPRHLQVVSTNGDPAATRDACGQWLRRLRGLPPAGAVGGIAALDAEQRSRLVALAGGASGPA
ncbi:MAG: 50S ribosome-binding GTPase [Planctomycetes bacterium]|nr:50S ribosome-binding GTPase [Planctomycetota bacterium]